MSEPSPAAHAGHNVDTSLPPVAPASPWARIKEHKVIQWNLAYLGAALALAHGQDLLAQNFHWPELVGHVLIGTLIVGFPIAVALAWYHGHRGMTRFSAPEMTVVALLLVIAGVLLTALVRVPEEHPSSDLTHAPPASVAVVPFTNLTGEAGKEYFSDGMAEELINELTKVPGLKVPARTSSFAYKGRNIDIRQIAHDLGVATILEGSVRSAGERIRVTAQLVNAQTGYHIWSNTYDRNFGDVFKVQDEISAEIVEALKSSMNVQLPPPVAQTPPTQDLEAYRLYLQALAVPPLVSISLLAQATARDPKFARAFAASAVARVNAAVAWGGGLTPDSLAAAERDANQAIALDPNLADARAALGTLNALRGNWVVAESSFRQAVELDPRHALASSPHIAAVLLSVGHLHRALEEARRAYDQEPANTGTIVGLPVIYAFLGMDGEAAKIEDLVIALGAGANPTASVYYTLTAWRDRHYEIAVERVLPALPIEMRSTTGVATIKQVFAAFGEPTRRPAAARALASLMQGLSPDTISVVTGHAVILWYVMLGDLDLAFDFANRSLDEFARSGTVGFGWGSLWSPEMRPFRHDPRFQALATRMKLFDYWKQHGPPDDCDLAGERLLCR